MNLGIGPFLAVVGVVAGMPALMLASVLFIDRRGRKVAHVRHHLVLLHRTHPRSQRP